jgi:hypothetical protein
MKYVLLTVFTYLLTGCQSTADRVSEPEVVFVDSTSQASKNDARHEGGAPEVDLSNSIKMTPEIFSEITSQLPEKDKFGEYSKKYGDLISNYSGVYYTDALLSDWNSWKKSYDIPLTIISSEPEKITNYKAVNGFGANFIVTRVDMYENRILLKDVALSSIPVDVARDLDGNEVRIYYKLTNQSRFGSGGPAAPHNICKNQRWSTPTSSEPFDIWDHGCEISASVIKIVSLKDGSELELMKLKSYEENVNYDMRKRGLELIGSYLKEY